MALLDFIIMASTAGFLAFNYFRRNKANHFTKNKNANNNFVKDNLGAKFNALLEDFSKGKMPNFGNYKFSAIFLGAVLVVSFIWLLSGFYIIQPDQEGAEMRLGKYNNTTLPGLHYHLPYPIETVYKLKVTAINTEEIGYRSVVSSEDSTIYAESTMITKDENIVDINFDVQWRISNASDYLFNMRVAEISSTVRYAAESIMREIVGNHNMSFLLIEGRAIIAEECRKMMQKILDDYGVGIQILSIPIKKIDPPKQVRAAFLDVQSAMADREREINMAQAYSNDILPRAKGNAAQIINEAESYSYQIINKANGEVAKMMLPYQMYKDNKELTKIRLYTELLSDVFSDTKKIIVGGGGKSNQNMNILNMGDFLKNMTENKDSNKGNRNE